MHAVSPGFWFGHFLFSLFPPSPLSALGLIVNGPLQGMNSRLPHKVILGWLCPFIEDNLLPPRGECPLTPLLLRVSSCLVMLLVPKRLYPPYLCDSSLY